MSCCACGEDTSQNKRDRRLLSSSSTQHIVPTLYQVWRDVLSETGTNLMLNEPKLIHSHVCKACFRVAEKILMLSKQFVLAKKTLRDNCRKNISYLAVPVRSFGVDLATMGPVAESTPIPSDFGPERSKRTKQGPNAPIAECSATSGTKASPAVTVSSNQPFIINRVPIMQCMCQSYTNNYSRTNSDVYITDDCVFFVYR